MVVKQLSKAAAEEEGASRVAGIMAGNGAGYPAPFSIYCISKVKTSISCIKYFKMLQNVTILCEPLKRIGLQKMKSKNTQKRSENAKNL